MEMRPEDKPKLIALASALGVVVLYLAVVQVPKLAEASAPTAPPQTVQTPNNSAPANGQGLLTAPGKTPVDLYAEVGQTNPSPRNPFHSPAPPPDASTAPKQMVVARPVIPPEMRPWPAIELQGIMQGNGDLAVIKVGDRVFCVKAGDRLDDDVRVERIAMTSIELSQGRKRTIIGIGRAIEPDIKPMSVTGLPGLPSAQGVRPPGGVPVARSSEIILETDGTNNNGLSSKDVSLPNAIPFTGHDAIDIARHESPEEAIARGNSGDVLDPLGSTRRAEIIMPPKRRDPDSPDG